MSILWDEAREIPATLNTTLDQREGFDAVIERLADPAVRRIVATGNGAAYYAAMAVALAALWSPGAARVIALPAGIVADRRFRWFDDDLLLAVSSSGEFRDVVAAAGAAPRTVAVTANRTSTLAQRSEASAIVHVQSQRAVTHTQAYCGGVATLLALWSEATGEDDLRRAVAAAPGIVGDALEQAEPWAAARLADVRRPVAAVAFGTGLGWAAALEAALLLKEVAGVPAEGVETREGATSAMYALGPDHVVLSIGAGDDDPLLDEAERVCASTGATVVRIPAVESIDPRLTPLASFPAALALAIGLGTNAGLDVDTPSWVTAYASTSRVPSDAAT